MQEIMMSNIWRLAQSFDVEKFIRDFGKNNYRTEKQALEIILSQEVVESQQNAAALFRYFRANEIVFDSGYDLASDAGRYGLPPEIYLGCADVHWHKTMQIFDHKEPLSEQGVTQISESRVYYFLSFTEHRHIILS
jgi:hypothetical protein